MKLVKQPQRLFVQIKKAVLREDLMKLTDDVVQAMVLGQMIYWTKTLDRVNDWLFEENKRLAEADLPQHEYNYGWIWKSAREMRDDLMGAFSEDAIQRAFTNLAKRGILMKRNNPYVKYDRKLHYRIDLVLLRRLLLDMGFEMLDFQLASIPQEAVSIPHGAESMPQCAGTITEIIIENTNKELPLTPSKGEVESSAMASRSTGDLFNETANAENGATAQAGKADALFSRPPNTVKKSGLPRTRKSPPIDDSFFDELRRLHPDKDVDLQKRKAETWLLAHPQRKFTRAFFANWMNRCKETINPEDEYKPTLL